MRRIGKVDYESNKIIEYKDLMDDDIFFECDLEVSDSMKLFSQSPNPSVWLGQSFIDNNMARLRVKPTKIEHGWLFYLVPIKGMVEGAVYLITDHFTYKYNLRFNETK